MRMGQPSTANHIEDSCSVTGRMRVLPAMASGPGSLVQRRQPLEAGGSLPRPAAADSPKRPWVGMGSTRHLKVAGGIHLLLTQRHAAAHTPPARAHPTPAAAPECSARHSPAGGARGGGGVAGCAQPNPGICETPRSTCTDAMLWSNCR